MGFKSVIGKTAVILGILGMLKGFSSTNDINVGSLFSGNSQNSGEGSAQIDNEQGSTNQEAVSESQSGSEENYDNSNKKEKKQRKSRKERRAEKKLKEKQALESLPALGLEVADVDELKRRGYKKLKKVPEGTGDQAVAEAWYNEISVYIRPKGSRTFTDVSSIKDVLIELGEKNNIELLIDLYTKRYELEDIGRIYVAKIDKKNPSNPLKTIVYSFNPNIKDSIQRIIDGNDLEVIAKATAEKDKLIKRVKKEFEKVRIKGRNGMTYNAYHYRAQEWFVDDGTGDESIGSRVESETEKDYYRGQLGLKTEYRILKLGDTTIKYSQAYYNYVDEIGNEVKHRYYVGDIFVQDFDMAHERKVLMDGEREHIKQLIRENEKEAAMTLESRVNFDEGTGVIPIQNHYELKIMKDDKTTIRIADYKSSDITFAILGAIAKTNAGKKLMIN